MRPVIALVMVLCYATVSAAQSTFISGSLVGEIARFDFVDSDRAPSIAPIDLSVDGEAVGFGASVERSLGDRWGVALEFVRPGTMTREDREELPVSIAIFPSLPPVEIERRLEQKRLSWNTMAWVSQPVGSRVELAFAGGIAFTRTKFRQQYSATVSALVLLEPGFIAPATTSIEYSVEPIVGVDARIELIGNLSVVSGVRFQSARLGGRRGWLLRPSAGLRWGF